MRPRFRELDRQLLGVVGALAAYGLATLYSAGQTDVPTFATTIWHRQLLWLALGLFLMLLMYRMSPRLLEWATPFAYGAVVCLLLLTLVVGSGGGTAASSRSWISIGGVRLGQPAELAKLALVLYLAAFLAKKGDVIADFRRGLLPPLAMAGLLAGLVLAQPDLGTCLTLITLTFTLLFLAGGQARHLGLILAAALFTLRTRWLIAIAVVAASVAWLVRWWRYERHDLYLKRTYDDRS